MTIANIFDILLLVLLAVVTLRYMQKGFLAGLIQFLGNLLGLVGAALLSPRVADWIFATFFKGGLTTQIQTTISQQGTVDLAALVDKYAGFLPDAMEQSLVQSATDLMNSDAPDLAHSLVTELIQPLVTPLITVAGKPTASRRATTAIQPSLRTSVVKKNMHSANAHPSKVVVPNSCSQSSQVPPQVGKMEKGFKTTANPNPATASSSTIASSEKARAAT